MDILNRLRLRLTDGDNAPDDDVLVDCIETAKNAILSRRYPYQEWPVNELQETYVEPRYEDLQFRIALDLYNKIGAEGEIQHIENGIHRNYKSGWISSDLLEEVTPFVGIPT